MDYMKIQKTCPYFCTIGNGMEKFCLMELCKLKNTSVINVTVGKVFFTSDCKPEILLSLKSIERLFIMVFHCKQFLCSTSQKVAFVNLQSFLEKDIAWQLCLKQWITFQSFVTITSDCSGSCSADNVMKTCEHSQPNNKDHDCNQEPFCKKVRLDGSNDCVTFRVSCKSTGIIRRTFSSQKLSRFIGCSVTKICGWQVNLRRPQLEVYVHANDEYFTVGLPVVSRPLSERRYLKYIALRSTVCYAMLLCAGELSSGSLLLDPMCGAGTLITEAAMYFQNITIIGMDIDGKQLDKARQNKCNANTVSHMELIQADVTHLPFASASVNCIVCDLPFGNKFGTPEQVKQLFPLALKEMNRILVLNGRVVLLINEALKEYLHECVSELNKICTIDVNNEPYNNITVHSFVKEISTCPSLCTVNVATSSEPIDSFQPHALLQSGSNKAYWVNKENHRVKLGEMFASICIFEKLLI